MEQSILTSTKKILNISEEYTAFDQDILTHINASFSNLSQLGVGPTGGFAIEDSDVKWEDYTTISVEQLSMVKTYIYLKVKLLFDPPATQFLLEAANKQIEEFEQRISWSREELVPFPPIE